jgi:hypothetical protein
LLGVWCLGRMRFRRIDRRSIILRNQHSRE